MIFSIFFYASETWTLRETEKKTIDALEMWCWRRMLGVTWNMFRTNESIQHQSAYLLQFKCEFLVSSVTFPGVMTCPLSDLWFKGK
ncbi:jg5539 [Pararge aegeria aegeria]|uniref:Jg5539 protein n=1 Tax=Pararge aegeria aegeria TaxID=348720 RepID=A0A8S4RQT6_9NEOP|nr:jg5539 [Pararge aegeria aegeria]